jgi:hypothetical protein
MAMGTHARTDSTAHTEVVDVLIACIANIVRHDRSALVAILRCASAA